MPLTRLISDPSWQSPRFLFNTGQVVNGLAELNPTAPSIPGAVSQEWNFTSWGEDTYLDPSSMTLGVLPVDPTLGSPTYSWANQNQQTAYSVYQSATYGNVYGLYASNGTQGENSHTCTFLSASVLGPITMDHNVDFTMNSKVAQATGTSFGGTAQAESGFTLGYDHDGVHFSLFLQFSITAEFGSPGFYHNESGNVYIFNANFATGHYLPFLADSGPLNYLTYNVNAGLLSAISYISGTTSEGMSNLTNLANWTLNGFYVGSEQSASGGHRSIGLDVANINLQAGPANSFTTLDEASVVNGVYQIATGAVGEALTSPVAGAVLINSNGNDTIDAGLADVTVKGAGQSVYLTGGPGTCVVESAHALVYVAGSGNSTINASGPTTITGGSGSLNVTTSASAAATVHCGDGDVTIAAGGASTVIGGAGTLVASAGRTGKSILAAGSGAATLTGGGAGDSIFGGTGADVLRGAGNSLIVAGTGGDEIFAGSGDTVFGSLKSVIHAGYGSVVVAGQGSEILYGQDAAILWTGGSTGDTVYAGSGSEIVAGLGSSGNDVVYGSAGSTTFYAGSGADTVYGSTGTMVDVLASRDTVELGSGASTVFGSLWNTIVGGAGTGNLTAVLTGDGNDVSFGTGESVVWNSGGNSFTFHEGLTSNDIISNFDFSRDRLVFDGFVGSAIQSETTFGSAGLSITLTDGTHLSILNAINFVAAH